MKNPHLWGCFGISILLNFEPSDFSKEIDTKSILWNVCLIPVKLP